MMEHVAFPIEGMMLVVTALPHPSHTVRLQRDLTSPYIGVVTVSELDDGRVLFLSAMKGEVLTLGQWREAAARHFPLAREVQFERRRRDGTLHFKRQPIF